VKKIIQIIGSLGAGGAERVVLNLDILFKQNGIDSKVIVLKQQDFYNISKNTIINLNATKDKAKKTLIKLLEDEKPDLILAHMQDMSRMLIPLNWNNIYNVVHTDIYQRLQEYGFIKQIRKKIDFKKIYTNKNIITVSKNIENSFKLIGIGTRSIQTIYNPFDFDFINEQSNMFISHEQNYIIHVASLRKVKRQDILLKAFANLNSCISLVILGDGMEKERLLSLAKSLKIDNRVKFLGWHQNPYPYIKYAKLLVLSSEAEGLPNVIIESLILGTPVVSTDCNSGPREILIDELKNYLSKVNDVDDLARKIDLALNSYPKIDNKYYANFEINKVLGEYLRLM